MTPEGKVKKKLKELLAGYEPDLHQFWPVQNGMGTPALDVHGCFRGHAFAIETKAPGKHLTPRQVVTGTKLTKAGCKVFLIDDSEEKWIGLAAWLEHIWMKPSFDMNVSITAGPYPPETEADFKNLPGVTIFVYPEGQEPLVINQRGILRYKNPDRAFNVVVESVDPDGKNPYCKYISKVKP